MTELLNMSSSQLDETSGHATERAGRDEAWREEIMHIPVNLPQSNVFQWFAHCKSSPEVAPIVPERSIPVICRLAKVALNRNRKDVRNNEV